MSRLRELRESRGWSLADAAQRLGTNAGNLSRIERGEQRPRLKLAARMATEYGVSEMEILYPERYDKANNSGSSSDGHPPPEAA